MNCKTIKYSGHAVRQMFERRLSNIEVEAVVRLGETVAEYADDKPYPSRLLLGYSAARPVHVLVAHEAATESCIIVTAYEPDIELWLEDFKTRRKK
ncbi:MAG: DUF4258 domain-containing protein [Rhizobacter sp.]|nr:DUF4258 domain-containing protein [Chlorobiales bacterium]